MNTVWKKANVTTVSIARDNAIVCVAVQYLRLDVQAASYQYCVIDRLKK